MIHYNRFASSGMEIETLPQAECQSRFLGLSFVDIPNETLSKSIVNETIPSKSSNADANHKPPMSNSPENKQIVGKQRYMKHSLDLTKYRRRRNLNPHIQGNNFYGRRGKKRCVQCRKWRQKVSNIVFVFSDSKVRV